MADPDSSEPVAKRMDWLRAADGVFLVGLGVFLYFNASGRLPWIFWYDALTLWPILLVSGGLRIAFGRTRWGWLALLGPMVVLATLAAVAGGRLDAPPGPWQPVSVRAEHVEKLTLRTGLASSHLDVTARSLAPGLVVEGRQGSRESKAGVETKQDGTNARVSLVHGDYGWGWVFSPGRFSRWDLGVTDAVPVDLQIDGAMIGARVDLAQGRVQGGTFNGAFLGLALRLPRPAAPVHLEVHGVFTMVDMVVPPGTPVRVHGVGFPFNIVSRGTGGNPLDLATPGYDVRFEGVFSRIGVTEAPPR